MQLWLYSLLPLYKYRIFTTDSTFCSCFSCQLSAYKTTSLLSSFLWSINPLTSLAVNQLQQERLRSPQIPLQEVKPLLSLEPSFPSRVSSYYSKSTIIHPIIQSQNTSHFFLLLFLPYTVVYELSWFSLKFYFHSLSHKIYSFYQNGDFNSNFMYLLPSIN